jgi:diguanylate cyclase (GGDEF)-like protein
VEAGRQKSSWTSAIRIPRADALDELSYSAQCVEIMRPLLPVPGVVLFLYSAYLVTHAWPAPTLAQAAWLALSLAVAGATLSGSRGISRVLGTNQVLCGKIMCLGAVVLGLLLGSVGLVFPQGAAAMLALGCAIAVLITLGPLPPAQFAFLASYGLIGLLTRASPVPAGALALAMLVGLSAILLSARTRFVRARARMELQSARIAQKGESNGSFEWETDARGDLAYASETLFKALGMDRSAVLARPLWDLTGLTPKGREPERSEAASALLNGRHEAQDAFCDVLLRVYAHDGAHRLSLSGRPQYDARGCFTGFRGVGLDLTDYSKFQERLVAAAERDALTKLMNRACFNQRLEELLSGLRTGRCATALMLIDLDKFKQANDLLGHQVGDKLLMQFADRLRSHIGSDGFVGRLGGDEFGVVLHSIAEKARLDQLARDLVKNVSAPYEISGQRVEVGATIGIAIAPEHGETVDALVRNADLALYSAKARGGSKHRFFDPTLLEHALERRRLEIDLADAIEKGELSVLYQPIVDAASERLCGFEALARWHHPQRGEVAADEFIPLAEVAGMIHRLGEWVLREACMEAAQWPSDLRLAVNLSPTQLANPGLTSIVVNSLAHSRLLPSRLELEITENVFLEETENSRNLLKQLHDLGVNWTLDDFGTGYSSLRYLLKAPFSKIKIDREFVNGLAVPESQKPSIVSTIVTLANNLGMLTTAEGVESLSDLRAARELGCTQIQGFGYGPKLTAQEARSLAKSRLPLPAQGFEATRREPRMVVLRSADIVCDGQILPGTVRNVSPSGAMIEVDWQIPVGAKIEVHMDHEPARAGTVRWVEGIRFGVEFDEQVPVPLPQVRRFGRPVSRASAA